MVSSSQSAQPAIPTAQAGIPYTQSATLNPKVEIRNSTWLRRANILTRFVSVQIAVQALGIASGILLVRTLSKTEYAYFTLAFSMLSTMSILADSGISIALWSIGGRVWQDRSRFGELINTALRLRRYLAAVAAIVVAPILFWLLARSGSPRPYALLITATVLVGLNYQLLAGLLMTVPRLHSELKRVQAADALAAAVRLALLVVAYFVFLDAAVAVWATIISVIVQYAVLGRWASDNIDRKAPINREDQREMLGIVKHQAPNAVFYCVQGQLTVWLISIFGNTQSIAEIGALGRLSVVFAVISATMGSVVLPAFARCQEARDLRVRYFQVFGGFCALGLALMAAAALFPDQILWILGSKYAHLGNELLLMMAMAAFNAVIAAMWSLNSTRAWIKYSWLNIPCVLATQIVLLMVLDISSLRGVILFGTFSLVPNFLLNAGLSFRGLRSPLRPPSGGPCL